MTYQVGISSGFWKIGRDPNLLGLAIKASGHGATAGVTFNQIDLETISEFYEPKLRENMRRVQKELGIQIGLHGEIGRLAAFESGDRQIWEQVHGRICETIRNATDLNIVYVNSHLSSTTLLQMEEAQTRLQGQFRQVVTPEGEPFWKLAEKSKRVKEYLLTQIDIVKRDPKYQKNVNEEEKKADERMRKRIDGATKKLENDPSYQQLPDRLKEETRQQHIERIRSEEERAFKEKVNSPDFIFDAWKNSDFYQYILEGGEIDAYMAVAIYMYDTGDPLWTQIAGNKDPEKLYVVEEQRFNAAVAARYIEGHIRTNNKDNKKFLEGMSIINWLNKHNLVYCFENPESGEGAEGLYRLYHPQDAYWLMKKLNCPKIKLCIDFEHMISQRLDPYIVIPKLPDDFGKYLYLLHVGEPKPYGGTAHIPIPLGSQAQEILYEWAYMFRQKGFKDGLIMFERGGGRTQGGNTPFQVFEQSVLALRQITKYLDKGTKPDELPMDFYGFSPENAPEWARQVVTIREHAYDPLEGVLSVPEEKHTFLSKTAVEKQKGQEWEKRKLR